MSDAAPNLQVVPDAPPPAPRPLATLELDKVLTRRRLAQEAQATAITEANEWSATVRECETELVARMNDAKAKRLPHPTLQIALVPQPAKLDKRESEFLAIRDLPDIPQREKDEMVVMVPQPDKLRTDATALKKYAAQYGPDHPLAKIKEKALVYEDRRYSLVIIPVEAPKKGLAP